MGSLLPDEKFFTSEIFHGDDRARPPAPSLGTWREAARELPVHAHCDVLVAGGGPSGTAAAVAAARLGADVILLERYNHLGGLSTGGLVIWIDRMTDWDGRSVIRGFAEEIFARLPKDAVAGPPRADWGSRDPQRAAYWAQRTSAFHGVVTWAPTIDPERLKLLSQQMVLERSCSPPTAGCAADHGGRRRAPGVRERPARDLRAGHGGRHRRRRPVRARRRCLRVGHQESTFTTA
jgi:hypothetical protein